MYTNEAERKMREGVMLAIFENPDDPAPRLALSDWCEEFESEHSIPQLLREEPGHYEVRNFLLYWVLDEPYSEWTVAFNESTKANNEKYMEVGAYFKPEEKPFKFVGCTHFSERKCGLCDATVSTGRYYTKAGWWCSQCCDSLHRMCASLEGVMSAERLAPQVWISLRIPPFASNDVIEMQWQKMKEQFEKLRYGPHGVVGRTAISMSVYTAGQSSGIIHGTPD